MSDASIIAKFKEIIILSKQDNMNELEATLDTKIEALVSEIQTDTLPYWQ